MDAGDALGQIEFAVLEALHRGALRSRPSARQIRGLREQPAGEAILHQALRRCEQGGLVRSHRDKTGRHYRVTATGRARLRSDRRFRTALVRVLFRSDA